jgi:ABC-type uncharacterized transport system
MKRIFLDIAIVLVIISLLLCGCTSNTTIIPPATTVTKVITQTTTIVSTPATNTAKNKVYFVIGDGEASPSDTLSDLAYSLNTNHFQTVTLNLKTAKSIPSDCAVLVIAGPTLSMTDTERQIIANYLGNAGHVIFMTNPESPNDIAQLLKPWGVNVQSSTIIDPSSYVAPNMNILQIPSARDYIGETNVYCPGATAIIAQTNPPTNMAVTPLVWTTSNSWLVNNFDSSVTPQFNPTTEIQQSYAVGVLIQPTDITDSSGNDTGVQYPGPHIVAFGDSDFINNSNFYTVNNSDLFLRIVSDLSAGS